MQWVDVGGRQRLKILLKMELKIDCILVSFFFMILVDCGIQVGAKLFVKSLLLRIIDYNLS